MIQSPHRLIKTKCKGFNLVALILSGGRIVSIGRNRYDRISFPWKITNGYNKYQGLHAEGDAINKWKNRKPGATMVVVGFTKGGNFLENTKPCDACMATIAAIKKISKIRYLKGGKWITEKVSNIMQ